MFFTCLCGFSTTTQIILMALNVNEGMNVCVHAVLSCHGIPLRLSSGFTLSVPKIGSGFPMTSVEMTQHSSLQHKLYCICTDYDFK